MVLAGSPPLVLRDALNTHVCGESGRGRLFARVPIPLSQQVWRGTGSASSERVRFWREFGGGREGDSLCDNSAATGRFRNVGICVSQ